MHIVRSRFAQIVLVALIASAVFLASIPERDTHVQEPATIATSSAASSSPTVDTATTTTATSSTPVTAITPVVATTTPKAKKASVQATKSVARPATSSPNEIVRVENPYPTPPLTFETVNISARAALVNIYCSTKTAGALRPITGSGVVVSPSGIMLTNAHVAQYVLIAQSGKTDLSCEVRTGAPARSKWIPVVMYIPEVWVNTHAAEIIKSHVTGTGEHDFALLSMARTIDGSPLPSSFAYLSPDTREAIGFVDDNVLVASYPVEFEGGSVIQSDLFAVTSITTVRQLMTFTTGRADAMSLGGVIGAQSGSSGGGVVNQWGRMIGLITTTSEGATTGERDLHAITTAYIDRDLVTLTGSGLLQTLAKDPKVSSDQFAAEAAALTDIFIKVIGGR